MWLGRLLWKGGDGWLIDGFGPDGVSARVLDVTRNVVRLQTGYLYHYAFAMLIGVAALHHLVHVRGGGRTDGELADPLRHHLPAARRRAVHHAAARRRGRRSATRAGSRCGPRSITFAVSLILVWRFDPSLAGIPVRREAAAGSAASITYHMGVDGISLPFVILTTALMPLCIVASWRVDPEPRQGIHDRVPGARNADGRHLLALDLVLFYLFFEGGLIPMFLIIGVWGGPRRVYASFKFFLYTLLGSVLMLLAIMAMYWQCRHDRHPDAAAATPSRARLQTWAVARLLRLVRGEDADVAGAHLAARRACRGADRGLGDPRRDPPEDGRLRLPALLAADVPGRLARLRAADVRAVGRSPSSTPRWSRWCRRT